MTIKFFNVKLLMMKKEYKRNISALLLIPLFLVITFCCCVEENAYASNEPISETHHHELEKSHHAHHSEGNQHQHSSGQEDCSCPKHLSFLSQQPLSITADLSSFQLLGKTYLDAPVFQVVFSSYLPLYANGPPWQNHRDYPTIPLFLKHSNLRI